MKLRSFLRPYIKESVLAPLLKLTEATLELFVPLVITAIIDRGIGRGDDGFILSMGGVLFLLAFVGMAVSITAQYFAARAATCFSTDMRSPGVISMEPLVGSISPESSFKRVDLPAPLAPIMP